MFDAADTGFHGLPCCTGRVSMHSRASAPVLVGLDADTQF